MASTKKMEMQVMDGLSTIVAGVYNDSVAAFEFVDASDLSCNGHEVPKQRNVFGDCLRERAEMLPGDDQDVRGRLRVDVRKGEAQVVFVKKLYRDRSSGELAEEAIGIW